MDYNKLNCYKGSLTWKEHTYTSAVASNAKPKENGIASSGSESKYSRADHVHPLINVATTSKAGLMSPEDKALLEELKTLLINK